MLNTIFAIYGDGTGAVPGDYQSIATTTVGAGGAASISFTSIPATYQHLQIRAIGRSSNTVEDSLYRFNSDTQDAKRCLHSVYAKKHS